MKPKIILLVLSLLLFGCSLPFSQEKNPNVEVVVEKNNIVDRVWSSSPGGDKIMYSSPQGDFLLYPEIKEQKKINDCSSWIWLDDTNLMCWIEDNPFVLQIDDFTRIPLIKMEASMIPNLDELLQTATVIYKYEKEYNRDSFYLLNVALQQNYQVITDNVDEVLQGYDYKVIPKGRAIPGENEYSPNDDYYFVNHSSALTIYNAITSEVFVEYDYDQGRLEVGGWAADGSGVYFQPIRGGGMGPMYPGAILKLKIPEAYFKATPAP